MTTAQVATEAGKSKKGQPLAPALRLKAAGGYRLDTCEVYNWGTFNGSVWAMSPEGEGALLTGPNGSGKSTLVDAFLTLLVPNKRRNYNLSSGSDKRERNEASYVRGAYQRESVRGAQIQAKYLRTERDVSALLARFRNPVTGDVLTLGQVFWFEAGALKKFFVVSHGQFGIAAALGLCKNPKDLRKRLLGMPHTSVFNAFSEYEAYFVQYFGLRSGKALELFNQITAIKQISSLNDFVRGSMLDSVETGEFLDQFYRNYENLTLAHRAIKLAKRQLEDLTTVASEAKALETIETALRDREELRQLVPVYFAGKKSDYLLQRQDALAALILQQEQEVMGVDAQVEVAVERQRGYSLQLGQDKNAQKSEKVELLIRQAEARLKTISKAQRAYKQLVAALAYDSAPSRSAFAKNAARATKELPELKAAQDQLNESLFKEKARVEALEQERQATEAEMAMAMRSKNQVPAIFSRVRDQLCAELNISKDQAPFAAELMSVRSDEREWEAALERLLRGFALRLLVSEETFKGATRYLKATHIGIKLSLHKVTDTVPPARQGAPGQEVLLVHKLQFQPRSAFTPWLKAKLARDYAFVCCNDLKEFHKHDFSITKEGLVKRSAGTLEKDDRSQLNDRSQFVLGWDSQEKVKRLQMLRQDLSVQVQAAGATIKAYMADLAKGSGRLAALQAVLACEDFGAIDTDSVQRELDDLVKQKDLITGAGTNTARLQRELKDLDQGLAELRAKRDGLMQRLALSRNEAGGIPAQLESLRQMRQGVDEGARLPQHLPLLEKMIRQKKWSLRGESFAFFDVYTRELQAEADLLCRQKSEQRQASVQGLLKKLAQFKASFPEQSADFDASVDGVADFLRFKQQLEKEALPDHESRFKTLLSKSTINDITAFKSTLDVAFEQIETDVAQLNDALRSIPYSASSYVQLQLVRTRDVDVRDFQSLLRNAIKHHEGQGTIDLEQSFSRIKEILDRLKRDERWCNKVTDVRNWADFFVVELSRDGNEQRNIYSDSAGLSGGQKAKLAFTILGSALAYQYGLNGPKAAEKSFRFVVIDEAFSKSDDKNAQYALDLFKQLGLQLMVVTPSDKIHVVEPYVRDIFVTQISAEQTNSAVYPLRIKDFKPAPKSSDAAHTTN